MFTYDIVVVKARKLSDEINKENINRIADERDNINDEIERHIDDK